MENAPRLNTFTEVTAALDRLNAQGSISSKGKWSASEIFEHCAQSIECSLTGFPEHKNPVVKFIARFVMKGFLKKGFMEHDLTAVVPGAPVLSKNTDPKVALARLRNAMAKFQSAPEPLAPHFAYGPVSKSDYERLHAMHFADHLRELT